MPPDFSCPSDPSWWFAGIWTSRRPRPRDATAQGRFAPPTRRRLQRGRFAITGDLEAADQAYPDRTGAAPEPFVRTGVADAILAGVERFCPPTPNPDRQTAWTEPAPPPAGMVRDETEAVGSPIA